MLDVSNIKPPLGAAPFHHMDEEKDTCGLCHMSRKQIIDEDKVFCPVMQEANKQGTARWREVLCAAISSLN